MPATSSSATAGLLLAAATASYFLLRWLRPSANRRLPLPPGPAPLPLLGNIRDLPPNGTVEYQHWLKHKDLYGPISSVSVMGMTLIIIHDRSMAHELLHGRSSKTSGRPTMVFANELCGYDRIALCQSYTPMFKRYRKMLHRELGTAALAAKFGSVQEVEGKRLLMRTLHDPANFLAHLKTSVDHFGVVDAQLC